MKSGKSTVDDVVLALAELARGSAQPATAAQLDYGLRSVSVRMVRRQARRRLLFRSSLAFASVAVCLSLGWGAVSKLRGRASPPAQAALAYQVEGGSVADGGYLRESGAAGMKLTFTEGTKLILMPGARGRLRTVDSRGAHLAIEQGSASFDVTPRPGARWLVDVGPFVVTVKGTVFSLSWDAVAERFELVLRHGQVSVAGPVNGGEIILRTGERLVVNLPKAETVISEQMGDDAWPSPGTATPADTEHAPPEGPSPPKSASPSPSGRAAVASVSPKSAQLSQTDGQNRWGAAMAAGRWDDILREAERLGVQRTLEGASSEDLFAVADAARYRRRSGLAREALLAERRRFPGSARALDAAFLLGRMEETADQTPNKALQWYEEYLSLAPEGTYASEALGRKMIVTRDREGPARVRPIAEEYLRRFPHGAYAGAAQALLRHGQ
jgi:hypothetical protein